jgi:hypothetical protein
MRALVVLLVLTACAPRNKIGDRLLGRDSITNGRQPVSGNPSSP